MRQRGGCGRNAAVSAGEETVGAGVALLAVIARDRSPGRPVCGLQPWDTARRESAGQRQRGERSYAHGLDYKASEGGSASSETRPRAFSTNALELMAGELSGQDCLRLYVIQ